MSRKEQERAIEAVRSQERFAAAMEQLKRDGREKERREIEKTYLILASQNKEAAQGFADAQAGMYGFTEASIKSMNATNAVDMQVTRLLQEGKIEAAEATDMLINARKRTFDALGTTMGRLGQYDSFYGSFVGDQRLIALQAQGIADQLKKAEKEIEDQQKNNSAQTKKTVTDLQEKQRENTRKTLVAMNTVAPGVTDLLVEFSEYLNLAVDALAGFVEWVADTFFSTAPLETQAATEYRKRAFKGASFAQDTLGIGRTAEQKKAQTIYDKGQQYEALKNAEQDEMLYNLEPLEYKLKYGIENPSQIEAKRRELKKELEEIVKQTGMEDKRARIEEMKKQRDESRQRRLDRKAQQDDRTYGAAPATMLPPPGAKPITTADLAARGLKFDAKGDVQRGDMGLSPKLIDLAEKVQQQVEGFQKFNGFNDRFHHSNPQYYGDHTRGLAFDFALNFRPTKEQGQKIVQQLKSMGFHYVRDEYNDPSEGATGQHIHAAIKEFRDGGILNARPGGEIVRAAENGYDEAFIPLKDGTVPVTITGLNLDKEISAAVGQAFDDQKTIYTDTMRGLVNEMRQTMTDAVSRMSNNNDVFKELLNSTQEMVRNQQQTNNLQSKMLQAVSN
jgi:hypothetical protein